MNQSVHKKSTPSIDAKAVSLQLDRVLQVRGIRAKVAIIDSCCYILLIAHQLPKASIAIDWVQTQLQESSFAAIDRIKIYGRQIGQKLPIWQQEFAL
ncbi:MAG: hypothetical protein WBB29_09010 [Geitlerinemataceae cyanobacterium]